MKRIWEPFYIKTVGDKFLFFGWGYPLNKMCANSLSLSTSLPDTGQNLSPGRSVFFIVFLRFFEGNCISVGKSYDILL